MPRTPEAPLELFAKQLRASLAADGDPPTWGQYGMNAKVAHHARTLHIWHRHRALGYTKCPCAACSWCLEHHLATTESPAIQLDGQAPRENHPDRGDDD